MNGTTSVPMFVRRYVNALTFFSLIKVFFYLREINVYITLHTYIMIHALKYNSQMYGIIT